MKIALLNYSGTVGKTTIAAHLLSSRMDDAPIFSIETINQSADTLGLDVEKIRGDNFRVLLKKLFVLDNAIIDVGASNVEDFMDGLVKFDNAHLEIDCYLVPVTPGAKELRETMSMLQKLADFGIPESKIRVVLNRVENDAEEEFAPLFRYHKQNPTFTLNANAAIMETELFNILNTQGLTIEAALSDDTDYKTLAKEAYRAGDRRAANIATEKAAIKAQSKTIIKNLDTAFLALFPA